MSHLVEGRAQMGTSLAFHLTFAILGVGLPVMMLAAEGLHLRTGDPTWRALARRWSKAFAILFAVGAVSGTIISFELGLLWPRFIDVAGRDHRPAVLARGLRVLPRGDLPRHLPLRLGPAVAARAPPRRRAGRDLRDRVGLLHRHGERVDERAARLPPRARRDHPHRPGPRAVQPGVADRDHAHGRRRAARDRVRDRRRSTRSACCAGAATATTARGSRSA